MTDRMLTRKETGWKVVVLAALLTFHFSLSASAQTDPEYRLEVGGGVGAVAYLGDFNGSIVKNLMPMFSAVAKYRFNPRMAVAMNISAGQIKGSYSAANTYYPEELHDYSFKHSLVDVGLRFEYNFWPFGTGNDYRGAQRLTPYIYIGAGMTAAKPDKTEMGLNMPIGGGVKYKLADRVNLAAEWTMHFSTNDRLDGVKDPYTIKSSGFFKNTDCYSHLRVSLTYDLWAKCKTCHNDK